MRHVNINITGPDQSGKTTVATKIEESLRALGFMTTRTENGERIPIHRQRLYNRHEWPTEEPCRVVINESWAKPKPSKVVHWLFTGRVGLSSKAMACVALGVETFPVLDDHPHDSGDFERCLALLDAAPEVRDSFHEIAKLSATWAWFIANWSELEALYREGKRDEFWFALCRRQDEPKETKPV